MRRLGIFAGGIATMSSVGCAVADNSKGKTTVTTAKKVYLDEEQRLSTIMPVVHKNRPAKRAAIIKSLETTNYGRCAFKMS